MAALQLTGCVVGPKYHAPAVQAPPAYKEVGDWKPAQPNDQNLGGTWWTIFQDPQLDAMELQVNVSNQNLKAAAAQFQQARAALRYNRANYYPTVTVSPSATRTRVSANRPPPNSIFNGITYNDFVLPSTFPTKPTCGGEHGLADSGPRRRMGSIKFADATRVLRQAGEQQRQLINTE
jgi:outer membrane protein TolC